MQKEAKILRNYDHHRHPYYLLYQHHFVDHFSKRMRDYKLLALLQDSLVRDSYKDDQKNHFTLAAM